MSLLYSIPDPSWKIYGDDPPPPALEDVIEALERQFIGRSRSGQRTCTCPAYPFPHRFEGGDCYFWWDKLWGLHPEDAAIYLD